MSKLSKETRDRIEADASKWSENQYGHDDINKDYLEGALHEAGRAQSAIEVLEQIQNSPTPFNRTELEIWIETARNLAATALAKYKEVGNG